MPPAMPPVLESPGNFHPPISRRPAFSLKGRRSPRLYAVGLALGLPGIAALLLYLVGVSAGFKLASGSIPSWLLIEAVSIVAAVGLVAAAVAQARQRRADGWHDYNGPSPLLTVGAFLAITTAASLLVAVGLKAAHVDLESPPVTLLVLLIYLGTYCGLVHFLAVRTGALTWRDIASPGRLAPSSSDWRSSEPAPGWARAWGATFGTLRSRVSGHHRLGDVLVALAMVLPLILASNLMSAAMLLVLGLRPEDISPDKTVTSDGLSLLLTFVAVAIVAPIGEEIFFRGFATNAWGRSLGHNSAILRSSLFFAFIHVLNTATTDAAISWRVALFNFGARVPVAFALTWLYMRRRSILASGTLHAGYNGLITIISFL
jgi:membrane protease YdiL (CAAX protease family)